MIHRTGNWLPALAVVVGLFGCGGGESGQGVPPGGGQGAPPTASPAPSSGSQGAGAKQKPNVPEGMEPAESKTGR
jgi:hypothetical protein